MDRENRDTTNWRPPLYALLACLTGWIGGGASGYLYAKTAHEINRLRGIPDDGVWHNPLIAAGIGIVLSPFSGVFYGYCFGKKEAELEEIRADIMRTQRSMGRGDISGDYGPAREREADYWHNRANQEEIPRQYGR